ncbi:putative phospholipase c [Diaporthe ampelina]|uniref:Putative phospholipase c n=1 Tax=Diaporthe ampelina TaxID=1214573 RepID=A0A0G2FMY8_9PEZI|nr:putative phospholipase c [Diaporthe ampelina]
MPSKGVQVYTYIAVPGCIIELSVPGQTVVKDQLHQFWNGDLEVESSRIDSFFDKTGRFVFKVLHEGRLVTEQWVEVNALTGSVGEGTMTTISNTHSVVHPDPRIIVSYGFYESGHGHDILPNRHQCYITVTPDYSDWLVQNCATILKHAGGAVVRTLIANEEKYTQVLAELADKLSGPAVSLIAPNIVSSLAITQKDPLPIILAAIPGMAYDEFLTEVVRFLVEHPTEIIVVQLRWDGVPGDCERPNDEQQNEHLQAALRQFEGHQQHVIAGNLDDLRNRTIGDLRRDRRRLIMLRDVDSISTYTDAGNATLNGDSIVEGFGTVLHPECCGGRGFINIQCQATASNIPKAVVYSVLEAGASTSCLLATKPICDSKTLPWVKDNALRACGNNDLVVVMNDFFDGATADVAMELSRQRLG